MKCPHCGQEHPDNIKFCPDCGAKLNVENEQACDFVDMGLSVKWARCNLGAKSPEEYGNYYAWGEIEPKDTYREENSKTYNKDMSCIAGNPKYDAATAALGEGVRIPTYAECKELVDNCTFEIVIKKNVDGMLVTSKINGNRIFIPAAGSRYGSSLRFIGEVFYFWSSSPDEKYDYGAYGLCFCNYHHGDWLGYWFYRCFGLSIRPVLE